MRIWDAIFHLHLCHKHSNALWNEGWIAYRAITHDCKGWRNHPEVRQFEHCPERLWDMLMYLKEVREFKGWQANIPGDVERFELGGFRIPYKSSLQQLEDLETKGCGCNTEAIRIILEGIK